MRFESLRILRILQLILLDFCTAQHRVEKVIKHLQRKKRNRNVHVFSCLFRKKADRKETKMDRAGCTALGLSDYLRKLNAETK
jgi:predicted metal-binding protein